MDRLIDTKGTDGSMDAKPSPVLSSAVHWIMPIRFCMAHRWPTSSGFSGFRMGWLALLLDCRHAHQLRPTLKELHWLPIRHRIDYKIAPLTYNVLDCGEPTYLHSRISFCVSRRELRSSADTRHLNALRTKTVIAFRSSASAVWNSLPLDFRSAPCIATFRKKN